MNKLIQAAKVIKKYKNKCWSQEKKEATNKIAQLIKEAYDQQIKTPN